MTDPLTCPACVWLRREDLITGITTIHLEAPCPVHADQLGLTLTEEPK